MFPDLYNLQLELFCVAYFVLVGPQCLLDTLLRWFFVFHQLLFLGPMYLCRLIEAQRQQGKRTKAERQQGRQQTARKDGTLG